VGAGAYGIVPAVTPLQPALAGESGSYLAIGGGSLVPIVTEFASGSYVLTLGNYALARSGGEYDQVYGGIGHYREELERQRQLAQIIRPTPRPITHEIRPVSRPIPPVMPRRQPVLPVDRPLAAAQRVQDGQQQQAAIAKRRRQEAEILLLAS